ncbi:MAG TPA: urease accessory protein UreD [Steroidobacteraceae bacterium]|jgi:urease accessory protein
MLVNTAGGMAGGDNFELGISVGERAQIIVTTAAAEKVYRTLGPDTKVDVKIDVAANATLCWLPQETILFDRSRLIRRIEVDLAPTARMILAEALVFGRSGMGEVIELGALFDQWRIRRANRLIHAEGISLDGAVSDKLSFRPIANGGLAIATVLLVPGDDAVVAAIRAVDHLRGELGASSWNGLAIVRFCAADGNALRHDLMQVLASLGTTPLPALWIA